MPRGSRNAPGGLVYDAINRAVARQRLFGKDEDYAAFERVLAEAHQRVPIRILSYCILPNHWHMALWPREHGELTAFLRWPGPKKGPKKDRDRKRGDRKRGQNRKRGQKPLIGSRAAVRLSDG